MTSSPPPGWYPDPNGTTRYWDGTTWTAHTAATPQPAAYAAHHEPTSPYAEPVAQYAPAQTAPVASYAPVVPAAQPQVTYMAASHMTFVPAVTGESNGMALAGFILGLVSFLFTPIALIPFLGWFIYAALSITGIVLSIMGIVRSKVTGTGLGLAIAGLILSIL